MGDSSQAALAPAIPVLVGPTAAGKTELASGLSHAAPRPLEVISADAVMVYRGLDLGSAKPAWSVRNRVPHHLVDLLDPWEEYDAASFARDAELAIGRCLARGHLPLVVGGTGFYVKLLIHGIPKTPKSQPALRAQLQRELEALGADSYLERLGLQGRISRETLRNPHRLLRALEVYRLSGKLPGEFALSPPRYRYRLWWLDAPDLPRRIAARAASMLENGLVAEVLQLSEPGGQALERSINYRQTLAALRAGREVRAADLEQVNLQYARRQRTFFRSQFRLEPLGRAAVYFALLNQLNDLSPAAETAPADE